MRKSILGISLLALVAAGAYTVYAASKCSSPSLAARTVAATGSACNSAAGAAACDAPNGKIAGNFDLAMSGVCRFACATKLKYEPKDVLAQPGAKLGRLTQCPVSGVVFVVDDHRPRVKYAGGNFVMCCDRCAEKLRHDPHHYLKT